MNQISTNIFSFASLHLHLVASPFHLLTMRHDTAQKTKREYGRWHCPAPVSQIVGEFLCNSPISWPFTKRPQKPWSLACTYPPLLHIWKWQIHLCVDHLDRKWSCILWHHHACFLDGLDPTKRPRTRRSRPFEQTALGGSTVGFGILGSLSYQHSTFHGSKKSKSNLTPGVGLWADISHIVGAQHTERPDRKHSDTKSHKCRHVILLVSMPSGENPWIHK